MKIVSTSSKNFAFRTPHPFPYSDTFSLALFEIMCATETSFVVRQNYEASSVVALPTDKSSGEMQEARGHFSVIVITSSHSQ